MHIFYLFDFYVSIEKNLCILTNAFFLVAWKEKDNIEYVIDIEKKAKIKLAFIEDNFYFIYI